MSTITTKDGTQIYYLKRQGQRGLVGVYQILKADQLCADSLTSAFTTKR